MPDATGGFSPGGLFDNTIVKPNAEARGAQLSP
jgi:hypothetical protein